MTSLIDRSCEDCDEPAVVGFGSPSQWLCLVHFEVAGLFRRVFIRAER